MGRNVMSTDTTPVRAGEEINRDALQRYLLAHLPELSSEAWNLSGEIGQFAGGHSNLTYLINGGSGFLSFGSEFVLRRPPLGPVAPTAHDMPREFRLLQAI